MHSSWSTAGSCSRPRYRSLCPIDMVIPRPGSPSHGLGLAPSLASPCVLRGPGRRGALSNTPQSWIGESVGAPWAGLDSCGLGVFWWPPPVFCGGWRSGPLTWRQLHCCTALDTAALRLLEHGLKDADIGIRGGKLAGCAQPDLSWWLLFCLIESSRTGAKT